MRKTAFGDQTSVQPHPAGGGRYRAVVSDQWNAPLLPQGGIITALALRAMATELGVPDEVLRSVTTVFAAQVSPGPVDIDVAVLRRGRTMSQAAATVRPSGQTSGHSAMAVFGGTRRGFQIHRHHLSDRGTTRTVPVVP